MAIVQVTMNVELPAYVLRELYIKEEEEPTECDIITMVMDVINADDYDREHGYGISAVGYRELKVENWKEEED